MALEPVRSTANRAGSPADRAAKRAAGSQEAPLTKRPKEIPKKGTKRASDVSAEEIADMSLAEFARLGAIPSETEAEIMCGLPTLHWTPLAGYLDWGRISAAHDERTGVAFRLGKVKKARGRELDQVEEHQVKQNITWQEARVKHLKMVRSRWVDGWKVLPDSS